MCAWRMGIGVVLTLLIGSPMALTQTTADLFDDGAVRDVRLYLHSSDLAQLRARADENTYYPADFEWQGIRVRNVAVRSRGFGSRSGTKLGLRVDFDYYTTGQRFLGLSALVLDNLRQDASMVRERLAMKVFARTGLPAPREAFVRLFIDNQYEGLYAVADEVDATFLAWAFADPEGYLFEFKWVRYYYAEYLGEDPAPYVELFEPVTRETTPAAQLYTPIVELLREAGVAGDDWYDRVDRYLDLPAFVDYLAVEAFLAQLDGVAGNWGMNNFYLYRSGADTRHRLVPWDQDHAFFDLNASIWLRADENVLVRGALEHPALRRRYLDTLAWLAASLGEGDWLALEVERMLAQIDGGAREDRRKPYTEEERASAVEALRAFVSGRTARVLAEVAAAQRVAANSR